MMVCLGHIMKILGLSHETRFLNAKLIIKIHLNEKCEKKKAISNKKARRNYTVSRAHIRTTLIYRKGMKIKSYQ